MIPEDLIDDASLWAISEAAHATAIFNALLRRIARDHGATIHVEVVTIGTCDQVSCEVELPGQTRDFPFVHPALLGE